VSSTTGEVGQALSVIEAIRALPKREQEVMALLVDGFRPAEIPEILGKSPATVGHAIRHARAQLSEKAI
jgi:DNA-directed RNA polymerase specialized sigma24 family protein